MKETIQLLKEYNIWRRGAEMEQPNPTVIGDAIDKLIRYVEGKQHLKDHSDKIDILNRYTKFLQKECYIDTDATCEEPYAIDEFMKQEQKQHLVDIMEADAKDGLYGHQNATDFMTSKFNGKTPDELMADKHWINPKHVVSLLDEYAKKTETIKEFVDWYNEKHTDSHPHSHKYIPNSEIGKFNMR